MADPMSIRASEGLRIRLDLEARRRSVLAGIPVSLSRVLVALAEERLAQIEGEVAAALGARPSYAGRPFPGGVDLAEELPSLPADGEEGGDNV